MTVSLSLAQALSGTGISEVVTSRLDYIQPPCGHFMALRLKFLCTSFLHLENGDQSITHAPIM